MGSGEMWTPGPWTAEPKGGRGSWIKGATGEWAALSCGDNDERADANARLIATAPDLVQELAGIADDLEVEIEARYDALRFDGVVHPSQRHRYERDMEPVRKARALVALARGEPASPQPGEG